jgi:hypothetical protein
VIAVRRNPELTAHAGSVRGHENKPSDTEKPPDS